MMYTNTMNLFAASVRTGAVKSGDDKIGFSFSLGIDTILDKGKLKTVNASFRLLGYDEPDTFDDLLNLLVGLPSATLIAWKMPKKEWNIGGKTITIKGINKGMLGRRAAVLIAHWTGLLGNSAFDDINVADELTALGLNTVTDTITDNPAEPQTPKKKNGKRPEMPTGRAEQLEAAQSGVPA